MLNDQENAHLFASDWDEILPRVSRLVNQAPIDGLHQSLSRELVHFAHASNAECPFADEINQMEWRSLQERIKQITKERQVNNNEITSKRERKRAEYAAKPKLQGAHDCHDFSVWDLVTQVNPYASTLSQRRALYKVTKTDHRGLQLKNCNSQETRSANFCEVRPFTASDVERPYSYDFYSELKLLCTEVNTRHLQYLKQGGSCLQHGNSVSSELTPSGDKK